MKWGVIQRNIVSSCSAFMWDDGILYSPPLITHEVSSFLLAFIANSFPSSEVPHSNIVNGLKGVDMKVPVFLYRCLSSRLGEDYSSQNGRNVSHM